MLEKNQVLRFSKFTGLILLALFSLLILLSACGAGGTDDKAPLPGATTPIATLNTPQIISPPNLTTPAPTTTTVSNLPVGTTTTANTACPRSYTVKGGDSLSIIANRYAGISFEDILELNNISNPSLIFPGQELCIPNP